MYAEKFGTTEDSEWITLVHGLFDEMENPFQRPNALEVVTRDVFEDKAQLESRSATLPLLSNSQSYLSRRTKT
jgi:hypothetical protein